MFNKVILKNFVAKQLEKKAAEEAKQQAMQQQAMPPQQQMMPPQQQQMPMAQAGVSVTENPPEELIRGFNPNAGVDDRFVEDFVTNVTTEGPGGHWIQFQGQSDKGDIKHQLTSDRHYEDPHTWTYADLKNATEVKFQGNIEEKKDFLKKLNRQNFWGARGFRGKGWKTGLTDEEVKQFKEEQPFFQRGRTRDVSYNLLNQADPKKWVDYSTRENGGELPKAQSGGGPNVGDEERVIESSEGLYYDPIRGAGSIIDGQQYFYPDSVNVVYGEDDIYESVFDPRVREKAKANYSARKKYEDAVAAREARIAEIEEARNAYARYKVALRDSTVNSEASLKKFLEDNADFQFSKKYLPDVSDDSGYTGETHTRGKKSSGDFYKVEHRYDPTADLSSYYPEEVTPLSLPYDIQYNLSHLPEDVDEGQFRQWINTYYPDYAKEHGIDSTVPRNAMNNIIKSAWYELGNEYNPFKPLPLKPYMLPEKELDRDIIRSKFEKTKPKSKGVLVSNTGPDGRTTVKNINTGGAFGQYDTPEQASIAMIEASTEGYTVDPSLNDISGEDLQKLYDFVESQPAFRPNAKQQGAYQAIQKMQGYTEGGPVRKLRLPKAQFGWMGDAYDYVTEGVKNTVGSAYDEVADYFSGNQGYVPDVIQPVADYAAFLGEGIYNKASDWAGRQYDDVVDYASGNQGWIPDQFQKRIEKSYNDVISGNFSAFASDVIDPTGLGREVAADVKDYMNPNNYETDEETGYYSIVPEYHPQEFETFDDAFAQARKDLGPGKQFLYNHVRYKTDHYGETESKSTNEILTRLKRGINKGEITENEYSRFVNLWNQVGQPDLSVHSDKRRLRLGTNPESPYLNTSWADATMAFSDSEYDAYRRDHVNPFTKALYIPGENLDMNSDAKSIIKRLTNELSHNYQLQQMGAVPFTSKIIGDEIRSSMIMEPDMKNAYERPGTLEYEAHNVLEPKFTNFVFEGDAKVPKAPLDLRQQGGTSGSHVEPDDSRKQSLIGMAGKFFDQNGNLSKSPFEVVQFFADQGASSEEIWGLFRHFDQDSNSDLVQQMISTYTGQYPNTYTQYAKTGGRVLKLKRK